MYKIQAKFISVFFLACPIQDSELFKRFQDFYFHNCIREKSLSIYFSFLKKLLLSIKDKTEGELPSQIECCYLTRVKQIEFVIGYHCPIKLKFTIKAIFQRFILMTRLFPLPAQLCAKENNKDLIKNLELFIGALVIDSQQNSARDQTKDRYSLQSTINTETLFVLLDTIVSRFIARNNSKGFISSLVILLIYNNMNNKKELAMIISKEMYRIFNSADGYIEEKWAYQSFLKKFSAFFFRNFGGIEFRYIEDILAKSGQYNFTLLDSVGDFDPEVLQILKFCPVLPNNVMKLWMHYFNSFASDRWIDTLTSIILYYRGSFCDLLPDEQARKKTYSVYQKGVGDTMNDYKCLWRCLSTMHYIYFENTRKTVIENFRCSILPRFNIPSCLSLCLKSSPDLYFSLLSLLSLYKLIRPLEPGQSPSLLQFLTMLLVQQSSYVNSGSLTELYKRVRTSIGCATPHSAFLVVENSSTLREVHCAREHHRHRSSFAAWALQTEVVTPQHCHGRGEPRSEQNCQLSLEENCEEGFFVKVSKEDRKRVDISLSVPEDVLDNWLSTEKQHKPQIRGITTKNTQERLVTQSPLSLRSRKKSAIENSILNSNVDFYSSFFDINVGSVTVTDTNTNSSDSTFLNFLNRYPKISIFICCSNFESKETVNVLRSLGKRMDDAIDEILTIESQTHDYLYHVVPSSKAVDHISKLQKKERVSHLLLLYGTPSQIERFLCCELEQLSEFSQIAIISRTYEIHTLSLSFMDVAIDSNIG